MKVIVLGGTGFLGKFVVELLKERGHEVFSVSRHEGVDINNFEQFKSRLAEVQPEVIVNCAAHVGSVHYAMQFSADMIRDNMQIVINIFEAVRQVCPQAKIINPISNCSYPGDINIQAETDWEKGSVHESVLAYGSVRRMIYAFAHSYQRQYKINSVNWLISNAYGPGDYIDPNKVHALNGIIIRLIKAKKAGDKSFEIWGSGKPIREWVYVEDVARILVESLNIPQQIYPLNLAQHKGYSIEEIAKIGAEILGFEPEFVFNTKFPDGAPVKILDDKNFRELYPDFKFTALDVGIKNTIKYYEKLI